MSFNSDDLIAGLLGGFGAYANQKADDQERTRREKEEEERYQRDQERRRAERQEDADFKLKLLQDPARKAIRKEEQDAETASRLELERELQGIKAEFKRQGRAEERQEEDERYPLLRQRRQEGLADSARYRGQPQSRRRAPAPKGPSTRMVKARVDQANNSAAFVDDPERQAKHGPGILQAAENSSSDTDFQRRVAAERLRGRPIPAPKQGSQKPEISPAHIEMLKGNPSPERQAQFDEIYGEGAARSVLNG